MPHTNSVFLTRRTDIRDREVEEEEEEEILGSDDEEQEDPKDYCKGELTGVAGSLPSAR